MTTLTIRQTNQIDQGLGLSAWAISTTDTQANADADPVAYVVGAAKYGLKLSDQVSLSSIADGSITWRSVLAFTTGASPGNATLSQANGGECEGGFVGGSSNNNVDPTGGVAPLSAFQFFNVKTTSGSGAVSISGFSGGTDGLALCVVNIDPTITFSFLANSLLSAAGNRFATAFSLLPGAQQWLTYSGATSSWQPGPVLV
jgi:hypothetical protein